ncbi:hypothetical protein EZV62_003734 [Acer yangbiense]|uniref:Uncharacterized protein n=1 Tax=Acer yangbiense TaxID=1000413 RepID=A0A5C7II92_9ROSI|nr:hypothetical protein EZV62_003734 [Acer yangbiense]
MWTVAEFQNHRFISKIRAIPSNASDNVYCVLLAHSAIHGDMRTYQFMWCSQSRLQFEADGLTNPSFACLADSTYTSSALLQETFLTSTLISHGGIHGEIAGYTGFTFGPVNGTRAYITFLGYFWRDRTMLFVTTDKGFCLQQISQASITYSQGTMPRK